MIYSKDKLIGLSVTNAIATLCSAATSTERWEKFQDCIELSDKQMVSVGGNFSPSWKSGLLVIDGGYPQDRPYEIVRDPPKKSKTEIELEAYVAALHPLVTSLISGELVLTGNPSGDAFTDAMPLKPRMFRGSWKIILEGDEAVLVVSNASGKPPSEYILDTIQYAAEPPRAASIKISMQDEYAPPTNPAEKMKRRPGRKEIFDKPHLERLRLIISEQPFRYLTEAVDVLIAEGKVKGASRVAIYERLRGKLEGDWTIQEGHEGLKLIPRVVDRAI